MTPAQLHDLPWFDPSEWPWEPHFLDVSGGRMHYVDAGSGPVVVLVQGTPGWCIEWATVTRTLVEAGHRVIACDPIGLGLSDRPAEWSYKLGAHTGNLRALLDHLHVDRYALVVHDFGGPIALPIAVAAPDRVTSLTVLNTWAWPMSLDPSFARGRWLIRTRLMRWLYLALGFSARVMVSSSWGRKRPLTRAHHRRYLDLLPDRASRVGTYGFLRATVDDDEHLTALDADLDRLRDVPTSIVWGMADSFVGAPHLARWRARFPHAAFHPLPDVGHFPQDEDGDAVAAHILARVRGAAPTAPA